MPALFENVFESLVRDLDWTPSWLRELRGSAYARFLETGLPGRASEDWKYTSTRALGEATFTQNTKGAAASLGAGSHFLRNADRLVFVDGVFDPVQSQLPRDSAARPMSDVLLEEREAITASFSESRDSLTMLNEALFSSGAFVRIKAGAESARPLHLVFVQSAGATAAIVSPRNLIFVEAGANVSILESHSGAGASFTNAVTDIFVGDGAHCQYLLERTLGDQTQFVGKHHFHIGRDARVESFNLALGGKLNRSHLEFRLKAAGSSAKLDGLYVARGQNHIDNVTEVLHLAPHTSSAQLYKGILKDQSRGIFNGKITIVKDAQHVDAQQLNKNLLMSSEAEVDSRPQLSIDANDVKCSHGATIGQIDEQELFYLQSRSIPREEARGMLAKAFIGDVLGRITGASYAQHFHDVLLRFEGDPK